MLVAFLAVAAWPASSPGFKIPKLPKVPKVTAYPVSVDVAGFVDFEWTYDGLRDCVPGYAKSVSEEFSFEHSRPRNTTITVVGGAVTMPYAIGGEAKVKASASGFTTTNYCPPTPRDPDPPTPECKTVKGKLGATLLPETPEEGDDALAPLGQGVMLTLIRKGGGSEPASCLEFRPTIHATRAEEDRGVVVDTTAALGLVSLPLSASSATFVGLKPGERISRTIKIGGGCDSAKATTTRGRLGTDIKRCTIGGHVVVVIKRLR